jgi:hypothetical protein
MATKANKINILHVFTVTGTHDFPYDMLRYDTCWPEREMDTPKLGRRSTDTRRVGMIGLHEPTGARWSSFGWEVEDHKVRSVG